MLKFILIAVLSWLIGVFGWAQIIGSLQNIKIRKNLLYTLILWIVILGVAAYVAIAHFNGLWALLAGYIISLLQVLGSGKIE